MSIRLGLVFYRMQCTYPLIIPTYIGVVDRSGFNISYLENGRKYDAAILEVGHSVTSNMIVPPGLSEFTITGTCDPFCTNTVSFSYVGCVYR